MALRHTMKRSVLSECERRIKVRKLRVQESLKPWHQLKEFEEGNGLNVLAQLFQFLVQLLVSSHYRDPSREGDCDTSIPYQAA